MATDEAAVPAPASYDELRRQVGARYPLLSARLRQIAEFILAHPIDVALETVAVVADRARVQPSALVRFAQAFGYDGFSEMQRVFRDRLADRGPSYTERLRGWPQQLSRALPELLSHFVEAGHHSLDQLAERADPDVLERAITLLAGAEVVHLMAQRRAYPVVAYMAYGLGHLGRRMQLLDGAGGMLAQQARCMTSRDVLIAVSFRPYAEDTAAIVADARRAGLPIVAITDAALSPIARLGDAVLVVEDAEVQSFRALTASMCLATTMIVGLGQRLVNQGGAVA